MRIYQDDPGLIFKALGRTLGSNMVYLGSLLKPILVLIVPVMIVFMQMDERYGKKALDVDDTTRLSVQLNEGSDPFDTPVSLNAAAGIAIDTKPVRIADSREIDWRLRVTEPGAHEITLRAGDSEYTYPVSADPKAKMIARGRSRGFMEPFVHPAAPAIPAETPFARISVEYPGASYPFLAWHVHWIVIFLIYSFVAAIAMKFIIKFEF